MLSHEDNERLVRVGKGTPLGELFRLYWIPFLPVGGPCCKDGQPKRVRLLGEDLVAFRDTEGRVGLVDQACPHRGAPLIFGRNEDCGLRCVYHGWKFDVTGAVTDMPAEPARSRLKEHVRIKAYPCRERNGMIWTYMGPDAADPPPLPNLEWNLVPPEQVHISVRVQECNWLQAVEGEIDSAHAPLLHGRLDSQGTTSAWIQKRDLRPTFECIKQDFGMSIAARRNYDANTLYWRVNQFILPFYTLVPPLSPFPDLSGHAWVPIDDENTLCIMFSYHPSQPLAAEDAADLRGRTQWPGERACQPPFAGPASRHGSVCRLLDEIQSAERLSVRLPGAADHLVLGLARAMGAGWRMPERRVADLRSHQGEPLLQRYRHRDDPAAAAGDARSLSRSRHKAEGRDRSRRVHGAGGVAAAAAGGSLGRCRRALHARAVGRRFRVRAVTSPQATPAPWPTQ